MTKNFWLVLPERAHTIFICRIIIMSSIEKMVRYSGWSYFVGQKGQGRIKHIEFLRYCSTHGVSYEICVYRNEVSLHHLTFSLCSLPVKFLRTFVHRLLSGDKKWLLPSSRNVAALVLVQMFLTAIYRDTTGKGKVQCSIDCDRCQRTNWVAFCTGRLR